MRVLKEFHNGVIMWLVRELKYVHQNDNIPPPPKIGRVAEPMYKSMELIFL